MAKENLVIRVSKVYTAGHWDLFIQSTPYINRYHVELPLYGKFPKVDSKEFKSISEGLKNCFELLFKEAHRVLKPENGIHYKCIFSDKYVVNGNAAPHGTRIETMREMTLPMSEQECLIVNDSIPRGY
mgnify:CR=1 FL=1